MRSVVVSISRRCHKTADGVCAVVNTGATVAGRCASRGGVYRLRQNVSKPSSRARSGNGNGCGRACSLNTKAARVLTPTDPWAQAPTPPWQKPQSQALRAHAVPSFTAC